MTTKDFILQTAVNLFNQYGTAKITTNQIAKVAGISPGNLYYHFENKSHIIREVYEQMIKEWETLYDQLEEQPLSVMAMKAFIEDNYKLLWRFRFFYRETVALLNADNALSTRHFTITKERFQRQCSLLQKAVHDGILHIPDPAIQLEEVLTMTWIIANHYLTHLESMGQKVEQCDFETGADLVMKVLYPYLS